MASPLIAALAYDIEIRHRGLKRLRRLNFDNQLWLSLWTAVRNKQGISSSILDVLMHKVCPAWFSRIAELHGPPRNSAAGNRASQEGYKGQVQRRASNLGSTSGGFSQGSAGPALSASGPRPSAYDAARAHTCFPAGLGAARGPASAGELQPSMS